MYKIIFRRMWLMAILAVSVLAAFPQAAQASTTRDMSPIRLQFDKQGGANGIWTGTVTGDMEGALTTQLLALTSNGPILNVSFAWIVSGGEQNFTAVLHGTLNSLTGQVEMDGTIVEGWLAGAQVHEEGQLIDPATGRFQGMIAIFPATAD